MVATGYKILVRKGALNDRLFFEHADRTSANRVKNRLNQAEMCKVTKKLSHKSPKNLATK